MVSTKETFLHRVWQALPLIPVIVTTLGFVGSGLVYLTVVGRSVDTTVTEFNIKAQEFSSVVDLKLVSATAAIDAAVGLFASSNFVSPEEFRTFADFALRRSDGALALAWAPLAASPSDAGSAGASDLPDYRITYLDRGGKVAAVQGASLFGDIVLDPQVRGTLEEGYAISVPLIGPRAIALTDVDFVIIRAVMANLRGDQENPEVAGYIIGFFNLDTLIQWARLRLPARGQDVYVFIRSSERELERLHYLASRLALGAVQPLPTAQVLQGLHASIVLDTYGAHWLLVFTPMQGTRPLAPSLADKVLLAMGLTGTILLSLYLLQLRRQANEARSRGSVHGRGVISSAQPV